MARDGGGQRTCCKATEGLSVVDSAGHSGSSALGSRVETPAEMLDFVMAESSRSCGETGAAEKAQLFGA